jgi:hypothetical protein
MPAIMFEYRPPTKAPTLLSTALSTGTRVASIDLPGPLASLVLAAPAGSATARQSGAAYLLSRAAFRATANRSFFSLVRELERIGATTVATGSRERAAFGISFLKLHVPEAVELLFDAVLNARLTSWEVADAMEAAKEELAAAYSTPSTLLAEARVLCCAEWHSLCTAGMHAAYMSPGQHDIQQGAMRLPGKACAQQRQFMCTHATAAGRVTHALLVASQSQALLVFVGKIAYGA